MAPATVLGRIDALEAKALDGSPFVLPDALGDGALLLVGFAPGHKDDAKAWALRLRDDLGPAVPWRALAVLPGKARLASKPLLAGVRKALKDERLHARVGVHFGDGAAAAAALGAEGTDEVCVLWADATGAVHWRACGPPTDEAVAGLRRVAAR